MTPEEIASKILGIPASKIESSAELKKISGWDSVKHVELIGELEKEFGVLFTIQDVLKMNSLESVRELLRRKGVLV